MKDILEDYIEHIKEARQVMLNEFFIENMVFITDKKNLAMIDAYYSEKIAEINIISKVKGIFGMKIKLVEDLPENVNFIIMEDEQYKLLKQENERLKSKLAEIKELLGDGYEPL